MSLKSKVFIAVACLAVLIIYLIYDDNKVEIQQGRADSLDAVPGLPLFLKKAEIADIPITGGFEYTEIKGHYGYNLLVWGKMPKERFHTYFINEKDKSYLIIEDIGKGYTASTSPWNSHMKEFDNVNCNIEKLKQLCYECNIMLGAFDRYTSGVIVFVGLTDKEECVIFVKGMARR